MITKSQRKEATNQRATMSFYIVPLYYSASNWSRTSTFKISFLFWIFNEQGRDFINFFKKMDVWKHLIFFTKSNIIVRIEKESNRFQSGRICFNCIYFREFDDFFLSKTNLRLFICLFDCLSLFIPVFKIHSK